MSNEFIQNIILVGAVMVGLSQIPKTQNPALSLVESSAVLPATAQSPLPMAPSVAPLATAQPRLHKMSLQISRPEDLKVQQGEAIGAGQIVADQDQERQRLQLQKEQLTLSLKRVENSKIIEPLPPRPVPELAPLPSFSTAEQEAAIEKAELELKRAQAVLDLKQRQIDYLRGIAGIEPAILEHESSQLSELQNKLEIAQSELELATGKLETAKNYRREQEYQHQLNLARRVEEANQAQSFYQRQLAESQEALRMRDYQLTDLRLKLSSVDDKLAQLSVIRSPYAGQIRRIKFAGQTGNKLNVELSIIVANSFSTTPNNSNSDTSTNPLSPAGSSTSSSASE